MPADRTRRTVNARFVDRTTPDERVVSVRVSAPLTTEQIDAYLSEAYPYPTYFRLDREPTLALALTHCTEG